MATKGEQKERPNVHCTYCGAYQRPGTAARDIYVGYEEDMLCRRCDREENPRASWRYGRS